MSIFTSPASHPGLSGEDHSSDENVTSSRPHIARCFNLSQGRGRLHNQPLASPDKKNYENFLTFSFQLLVDEASVRLDVC